MRHRKSGIKLNRTTSHREAMFRNMVTSLFKHDRIKTTDAKAKELRKWADHIVTLAKKGDLHARRQALSIVREKDVVHQLFENVEDRFGGTSGGYTRVIKLGHRSGDAASVSIIELVTSENTEKKSKKKKKKKAKTTEPAQAAAKSTAPEAEAQPESKPESKIDEQTAAPAEEKAESDAQAESAATEAETETAEAQVAGEEENIAEPDESSDDDSPEKDKTAE